MEKMTKEKAVAEQTQTAGQSELNATDIVAQLSDFVNPEIQKAIANAHEAALNSPETMEYFHSRGFTDEIIRRFKLGYSEKGFNVILPPKRKVSQEKSTKYKYILPFLDENGTAIYAVSELYDRENMKEGYSKYYNPKGADAPIFGEHYLKAENPPEFIYICEGVYDAISIEQVGGAAVALRGVGYNRLIDICSKRKIETNFIIVGDNDYDKEEQEKENTGQLNAFNLRDRFNGIGYFAYVTPVNKGIKDANDRLRANTQEFERYIKACRELAASNLTIWREKQAEIENTTALDTPDKKVLDNRFFQDKKFLHHIFTDFLIKNENLKRINGQIHIYRNGIYSPRFEEIEGAMVKYIPQLKRTQRAEVTSLLQILCRDNVEPANENFIAFNNGVYHLPSGRLLPFSKEYILTNRIPWNYNPDAYSELGDRFLNDISCNDTEIRKLIEEVIGYCFFRRNEFRRAFILIGDKANGKSTFLSIIQKLLGDDNVCNLDLKELGQRFKGAELFGKLCNIGDDISDEFNPDPALFKKITTGDRINVERKGQNPFDFNPYCKLIFSANNIPRIRDTTGAVMDRLCIIPFNARFKKDNPKFDPLLKTKLQTSPVMEYFINLGIEGLQRVLENQEFTHSQKAEAALRAYEIRNNSVLGFVYEVDEDGENFVDKTTNNVYYDYQRFCRDNGLKPVGKISFSMQIIRIKCLKIVVRKINGRSERVFAN